MGGGGGGGGEGKGRESREGRERGTNPSPCCCLPLHPLVQNQVAFTEMISSFLLITNLIDFVMKMERELRN